MTQLMSLQTVSVKRGEKVVLEDGFQCFRRIEEGQVNPVCSD